MKMAFLVFFFETGTEKLDLIVSKQIIFADLSLLCDLAQ